MTSHFEDFAAVAGVSAARVQRIRAALDSQREPVRRIPDRRGPRPAGGGGKRIDP